MYYGGLVESKREGIEYDREGTGIEYKFFVTDPGKKYDYAIFRGEWHNDAPNGPGTEYRHDKTGIDNLQISGNYVDEYYGAAEPPVRWWRSHLSGLSEPPRLTTGYLAFSGSNP